MPKGEVVLAGWILKAEMSRYDLGDDFGFKLFGFTIQLEAIRILQLLAGITNEHGDGEDRPGGNKRGSRRALASILLVQRTEEKGKLPNASGIVVRENWQIAQDKSVLQVCRVSV